MVADLLVTSDRLSAFDRVIGLVPHKGQVLNQLAAWWFERDRRHRRQPPRLDPRPECAHCHRCLAAAGRGRGAGPAHRVAPPPSILPRYLAGERVLYGHTLPDGLASPWSVAASPWSPPPPRPHDGGHDEPITVAEVASRGLVERRPVAIGPDVALDLFAPGAEIADAAGFVLADTKYEFGLDPTASCCSSTRCTPRTRPGIWATRHARRPPRTPVRRPTATTRKPVRLALRAAGYRGDGPPPELPTEVWDQTSPATSSSTNASPAPPSCPVLSRPKPDSPQPRPIPRPELLITITA